MTEKPLVPVRPGGVDDDSQPAPWVLDVLLGIGVALVVSLFIAADVENTQPEGWAYLWAVGLGGLMLVRRRYPVIVVLLSAGAVLSYYAAGYPAIGVSVPLAAAVFSAAEQGRLVAPIVASVSVLAVSIAYRLATGQDPAVVVGYELPGHALLLGGAIALGDGVRSRRALRRQASEIAGLVAERYRRETERRTTAERLAIARELHDSVGHALTVIALHAQIADEAVESESRTDADDATVRDSLRVIAGTASASFEELRRTVAGLRREEGAAQAPLRITDLDSAVDPARQAGVEVDTRISVARPLPPAVEAAVYRIVQESITNAVRHAVPSHIRVDIDQKEGEVQVSIVNDGVSERAPTPANAAAGDGTGLVGMRERANLLGGTFSAGRAGADFAVRASIPLAVSA